MNPDVKAKWVAALRSGEYNQADGALRIKDTFCCLGVLCDLYKQEQGGTWELTAYMGAEMLDGQYHFVPPNNDGQPGVLPTCVAKWAGLKLNDPHLKTECTNEDSIECISELNDRGAKFDHIADLIEQQL